MQRILILGGGLGGLFTGALLSKHGCQVTVLEKGHVIGGGLQTFKRNGFTFETGMHILGGFQPGGSVGRICDYLGILDKLDIVPMPADCMAEIVCIADGTRYRIPQGREAFTEYLISQFPAEADNIRRYIDDIYEIAAQIDLFNLRQSTSLNIHEAYSIPVGSFLERYTHNPRLLNLLAFMSTLYGGQYDMTPAHIHALINVLYINGSSMFGRSSQQLADALAEVIRQNGGEVLPDSEVISIETEQRRVKHVVVKGDRHYEADVYISSLPPTLTIGLCSQTSFPKAFITRLNSIPHSYSAFKVFFELRGDEFEPLASPVYIVDRSERFWQMSYYDEQWPQGMALFMTHSEVNTAGNRMLMAVCPMSFDAVRQWSDSTSGHRPSAYYEWKQLQIERVTSLIARHFKGFESAVVSSFASSPLTFRDWLGTPEGSMYGYCKDANDILRTLLPIHTKVSNLLMTGQNINLHGICGVPLTAIQTAEAVLGSGVILNAIHQHEHSET